MSTKKVTALSLDKEVIKALSEKAEEESRSISAMANLILKKYLQDKGE